MQTLFVPKYGITYRVNPKDPCELQWSKKPFGPLTSWQHAYTFSKPIRALDTDDKTGQGVVVLNDSTTYVGSGVRVWGRKFYTAGSRIYSLYAIGESKEKNPMSKMKIKVHESNSFRNTLFETDMGSVTMDARFPGVFAFFPKDADGRNDDCTYYFSLQGNFIIQRGWHFGRGSFDPDYIKDDDPWLDSPESLQDPDFEGFHDEKYNEELCEQLCKVLGSATY